MSVSYTDRRRLYYRIDTGYRLRRRREAYLSRGRGPLGRYRRDSWSITEMCRVLQINARTLRRLEQMGVVPKPTYPSVRRRYWRHQALLLVWLFQTMRMEGWRRGRLPHFVGSRFWTLALTRLRTEWYEGDGQTGGGDDHRDGEDGAGEQARSPAEGGSGG